MEPLEVKIQLGWVNSDFFYNQKTVLLTVNYKGVKNIRSFKLKCNYTERKKKAIILNRVRKFTKQIQIKWES